MNRRTFVKTLGAAMATAEMLSTSALAEKRTDTETFDLAIIGTGFGATVAATAIADGSPATKTVMLERGVWFTSPERPIPDYLAKNSIEQKYQFWPRPNNGVGLSNFLSFVDGNPFSDKQPLYHYSRFDEVDVVSASGVGGGSLIYSNVTVRPFFDGNKFPVIDAWPIRLQSTDFDRAVKWMSTKRGEANKIVTTIPVTNPQDNILLGRSRTLNHCSSSITAVDSDITRVEEWKPLDLQVVEYGNAVVSDKQLFCERQGRCFLGCLPGARHTLNKTLMKFPLQSQNFSLKSGCEVTEIVPTAGGYLLKCKQKLFKNDTPFPEEIDTRNFQIVARAVVVAAGCLGTTELLLRSQSLKLSKTLGQKFSTNGDFSGFITGIKRAYGVPGLVPDNNVFATRGPINTSHVTYRSGSSLYMNIEDAGVPEMFAAVTAKVLKAIQGSKSGNDGPANLLAADLVKLWLAPRSVQSDFEQTESEMLQDTMWFNCMGNDDAGGTFSLDWRNKLKLSLSQPPEQMKVFQEVERILIEFSKELNGTYVPFPLWQPSPLSPKKKLVVTHPLGGCPIGQTATDGVVDAGGRVFKDTPMGKEVYPGLFAMDASIVPGPVAVNPTLTIVALSLKVSDELVNFLKTKAK